jgi:hypothetical protein
MMPSTSTRLFKIVGFRRHDKSGLVVHSMLLEDGSIFWLGMDALADPTTGQLVPKGPTTCWYGPMPRAVFEAEILRLKNSGDYVRTRELDLSHHSNLQAQLQELEKMGVSAGTLAALTERPPIGNEG